ncbi:hypothetical protein KSP40_PGU016784 [Platanthera guangdongensis]|uniref:Uncharacterized protein n=1 Tax=Platanthera guangdongensis TaxID=2320717 RepID=A0ABR2MZ51_9ASPA
MEWLADSWIHEREGAWACGAEQGVLLESRAGWFAVSRECFRQNLGPTGRQGSPSGKKREPDIRLAAAGARMGVAKKSSTLSKIVLPRHGFGS